MQRGVEIRHVNEWDNRPKVQISTRLPRDHVIYDSVEQRPARKLGSYPFLIQDVAPYVVMPCGVLELFHAAAAAADLVR